MVVREFKYVELIMNCINVIFEFVLVYNLIKIFVEKVEEDLMSGNFIFLKEDFLELVQVRVEFYRQIILVILWIFKVQVVKVVGRQFKVFDELMFKLMGINEVVIENMFRIRENRNVIVNLMEKIQELKVFRREFE